MSHTTRPKRSATKATPDASDDALLDAADLSAADAEFLWQRLYNGLAGPLNRQQRAAIARAIAKADAITNAAIDLLESAQLARQAESEVAR